MKNLTFVLPFFFISFVFSSCNSKEENDQTYEAIATVLVTGNNPLFELDNKSVLYCATAVTADTSNAISSGDRVLLYYTLGDTTIVPTKVYYPITLKGYTKVTIKNFVTVQADSSDSYGNASLMGLNLVGISKNYLNAVFYSYLSISGKNTFELVRMKKYENNTTQDTIPKIYFELRHNTDNLNTNYYYLRSFSFVLSPLSAEFPLATKFNINLKLVTGNTQSSLDMVYVPDK